MNISRRRGRYGIDAPYAPLMMAAGLLASLGLMLFTPLHGLWITVAGLSLVLAIYLHTTLRGKFAVWSALLDGLRLRGDERILDLGCGRGAILLMAAERVPRGRAVGIDIWSTRDQSGNAMAATLANAAAEGVAGRIELQTADMRNLPFADGSIDIVVSNVAIHNIGDPDGRGRAVVEALRVLRPGGRLLIADIRFARRYVAILQAHGAVDVACRSLGWRMWWGSPFAPTTLVTACKPVR